MLCRIMATQEKNEEGSPFGMVSMTAREEQEKIFHNRGEGCRGLTVHYMKMKDLAAFSQCKQAGLPSISEQKADLKCRVEEQARVIPNCDEPSRR